MLDFACMKKLPELSVFFPTYNEQDNISTVVNRAKNVLMKVADKWEIIIVNDGSKDQTQQVAEKLAAEDKRIKVILHKRNKGYGGALKTGFKNAKYRWISFSDSDGQFDFSEIRKFIEKSDCADLILGYRRARADSTMRKLYTAVWSHWLPKILLGLNVTDYSCGFKLIKKNVYKRVLPLKGEEKVTQIEMLTKAQRLGFKFAEVGVNHYPRRYGTQTGADIRVIMRSIRDLIKLWWQLR